MERSIFVTENKNMHNLFRLEVDTGSSGYGFTDNINQLLEDIESEFGKIIREEVKKWALNSKKNDQVSQIWNVCY